ncbi:hypothetical protein APB76_17665 [Vibrio bivalvicida]|uniref:Uncharacterized protein n=1 Tax=Vibrio bivalvicida TaxID=1276888 RepID=A0A177XXL4_9VIBR|nr:hypothetical protein APB76_17665 [Vibrio bivalvicida]
MKSGAAAHKTCTSKKNKWCSREKREKYPYDAQYKAEHTNKMKKKSTNYDGMLQVLFRSPHIR